MADERLREYFRNGRLRKYAAGEVILSGAEVSGAFYIQSGFVKIYSISDAGSQYMHIIYKQGEVFPLIWILRGIRRRVFYEAMSDVEIYEIGKSDFLEALKTDSNVTFAILRQLAEQYGIYADRLDNLQYKSAYERVAYRILFLASRFGQQRGKKILINAPITHEVIAESVNLARESVSRQVEKIQKKGFISYNRGRIVINDVRAFSREFSEPISMDLWGINRHQAGS